MSKETEMTDGERVAAMLRAASHGQDELFLRLWTSDEVGSRALRLLSMDRALELRRMYDERIKAITQERTNALRRRFLEGSGDDSVWRDVL